MEQQDEGEENEEQVFKIRKSGARFPTAVLQTAQCFGVSKRMNEPKPLERVVVNIVSVFDM